MQMHNIVKTLATITIDQVGDETDQGDNVETTLKNIINAIVGLLGIVCVIVMIIGGVTYMTSGGDAGKVKKGKDTILYGLIGLVICALSYVLVNFVIFNVLTAQG